MILLTQFEPDIEMWIYTFNLSVPALGQVLCGGIESWLLLL